jgi:SWI/SNF related-matrix-associated actin-dependent regulator of chromatin subfamily C
LKWEDRSNAAAASQTGDAAINSADFSAPKNRWCGGCKTVCTIACFYCDKFDLTLCARCYVRGNYRLGVTSSDFRRVEISEEVKAEWSEKETLHLMEAIMHFGDDWKKVAEHVGGRSERECVDRFIKLPFGEQFVNQPDHCAAAADDDTAATESLLQATAFQSPAKRMRFTPLADASNPIMAQAAFLSALVGVDVAEAAARAAVRALDASDGDCEAEPNGNTDQAEAVGKEVQDLETRISGIAEVQIKEMKEKIVGLEEVELQMENKLEQLHQMKNMLFIDQLTLLFHKAAASKTAHMEDNIKFE